MAVRAFGDQAPDIAASAYIDASAVVIGDVAIGPESSIWPLTSIRGDVHSIRIGARTNIQDGCVLHVTHDGPYTPGGEPLSVGNDVTVGHRAILHACTVGDLCLIGMGATLLDGVVVEPRCMVAAGSLIPAGKTLQEGTLWKGSPARFARELTAEELEQLAYSARHYVELKDQYLTSQP